MHTGKTSELGSFSDYHFGLCRHQNGKTEIGVSQSPQRWLAIWGRSWPTDCAKQDKIWPTEKLIEKTPAEKNIKSVWDFYNKQKIGSLENKHWMCRCSTRGWAAGQRSCLAPSAVVKFLLKPRLHPPDIWVEVFTRTAADAGIKKRLQPVASDIKYYSWLILSA